MKNNMQKDKIVTELKNRIGRDIKHFKGILPERYALAWNGYIAGAYEWGGLEPSDYSYLVDLLPDVSKS